MQTQDPREALFEYLLHQQGSDSVQSDSIVLLKEQKIPKGILYIIRYANLRQELIYATLIIHQTQAGLWEFAQFLIMGGGKDSAQETPQIAWTRFSYAHQFFTGIVVWPASISATYILLKDGNHQHYTLPLENNTTLLVTQQTLSKPVSCEIFADNRLLLSTTLGA